jgi:hypothetical protein
MGVPLGTSIGHYRGAWPWRRPEQVDAIKPWSTFRKMDDRPEHEQIARYKQQMAGEQRRIEATLDGLTRTYPGETLVVLCHCDLARWGPRSCHRRWFAEWVDEQYELTVPDLADAKYRCWECGRKVPVEDTRCSKCIAAMVEEPPPTLF